MAETGVGQKFKVFISYSRRDSIDFVDELAAGLELGGFAPFLDRHLRDRLLSVRTICPQIASIDFAALRATIAFAPSVDGAMIKRRLCERGVLAGLDRRGHLVIRPPLAIRPAELDVISGSLRAALTGAPSWRPAECCAACAL